MCKIIYFFTLVFVAVSIRVTAQENPQNAPNNAASMPFLEKSNKDYTVDLFTGISSSNIPIYNYQIDGLNLGVSIGYTCKGIRLDQIASSIGLGWDLDINGEIERNVNGTEDEITIPPVSNTNGLKGNWVNRYATQYNQDEIADVFTLRFGGRSLKFTIDFIQQPYPNQTTYIPTATTQPFSEVKIEILDANWNQITSEFSTNFGQNVNDKYNFRVTDEKGNVFEFERGGYTTKTFEYTINSASPYTYYAATHWVLKKVTTYSGEVINYTYNYYSVIYPLYKLQTIKEEYDTNNNYWFINTSTNPISEEIKYYNGYMPHISEIKYPNGVKVVFGMGNQRTDLMNQYIVDNIEISSQYENTVSNSIKYKFNYAYFSTPINYSGFNASELVFGSTSNYQTTLSAYGLNNTEIANYFNNGLRLKLKKISIIGNNNTNTEEPYYTFQYESEYDPTKAFPYRLTNQQDWFGYYNHKTIDLLHIGTNSYDLSIPSHTVMVNGIQETYGMYKSADVDYMKSWTLNKIINATNGITELYYKFHILSNPAGPSVPSDADENYINDGLCIEKVIFKDGYNVDNNVTTIYNFSNGYRFLPFAYYWQPTLYYYDNPTDPNSTAIVKERKYQNYMVTPITMLRGANHGYSDVAIEVRGYNNELISNTAYTFTNVINPSTNNSYQTSYRGESYKHYMHYSWPEHKIGIPLEVKSYIGTSSTPSSTQQYEYNEILNSGISRTEATYYKYVELSPNLVIDYTRTSNVYSIINNSVMQLYKKYDINYSGNNSTQTEHTFFYDNHNNISNTYWTDKNGLNNRVEYVYNYNYNNVLPNKQFLITSKYYKHSGSGGLPVSYNTSILNTTNGKIQPKSIFSFVSNEPLYMIPSYSWDDATVLGNNTSTTYFKKVLENTKFDNHNNVTETRYNDIDLFSTTLWDTRIGEKTAIISNAKYDDIAYTSFEGFTNTSTPSDYEKGLWNYNVAGVELASNTAIGKVVTGKSCFHLGTYIIEKIITQSTDYLLSFWSDVPPTVLVNNTSLTPQSSMITSNGYTLYYLYFNSGIGVAPFIHISRSSYSANLGFIDELRLHPIGASMKTFTYEPLFGISSSCDENNVITRYDYDDHGRVIATRDFKGNIISRTKHVIQGSDN